MKLLRIGTVCLAAVAFFALASDALAQTAYVATFNTAGVSAIDTATNETIEAPGGGKQIELPAPTRSVAITPDGKYAYVGGTGIGVFVIETATNEAIKLSRESPAIQTGKPTAIAITPDGKHVYVANEGIGVFVIDTATNETIGVPDGEQIKVGEVPHAIAITPDGKRVYVANVGGGVSVIDTATNETIEVPDGEKKIKVGLIPAAIAITPDGKRAYVANQHGGVSVIDTATNETIAVPDGEEITVGSEPNAIAITPDGKRAYVANQEGGVSVIDTATNETIEVPDGEKKIEVGPQPEAIALTADGKRVYVADDEHGVSVVDTATNETIETGNGEKEIKVDGFPDAIAITPDQSPTAALAAPAGPIEVGAPVTFDASASSDPDSPIAFYDFSFGDGADVTTSSATASHVFTAPGTYTVAVKATDSEGCSQTFLFTGQTAYCSGGAGALATQQVTVVAAPGPIVGPQRGTAGTNASLGVKVTCPKSAKPKGCTFKLQAVSRKPAKHKKATPESTVAKAKLKAGQSAIVRLHPKPGFAARLAAAKSVLVRETLTAKGKARTRYRKLGLLH